MLNHQNFSQISAKTEEAPDLKMVWYRICLHKSDGVACIWKTRRIDQLVSG